MPLAAKHDLGVGDEVARHRGKTVDTVLANADDGQPAPRRGIGRPGVRVNGTLRHDPTLIADGFRTAELICAAAVRTVLAQIW